MGPPTGTSWLTMSSHKGDLQKPTDPSAPKPEPKPPNKGAKPNTAPSEERGEPFPQQAQPVIVHWLRLLSHIGLFIVR